MASKYNTNLSKTVSINPSGISRSNSLVAILTSRSAKTSLAIFLEFPDLLSDTSAVASYVDIVDTTPFEDQTHVKTAFFSSQIGPQ